MDYKLHYVARDAKGNQFDKTFDVTEDVYRKAHEAGMTLRQYMTANVTDADHTYGDPMTQMMMSSGLVTDRKLGLNSPTMADLANGRLAAEASFRSPDGADTSLAARLLFPQLVLETMSTHLHDDGSDLVGKYNEMVSVTRSVNGKKVDQPLIDTRAPEGSRSGESAELAEPDTMVSITTGDRSFRIPSKSIGLTISDEALEATTIDLVQVVMGAQARGERIAMIEEQLRALVHGDLDRGIKPLAQRKMKDFDGAITANGQVTKRAYIKWLRNNYRIRSISHVLTDLDTIIDLDDQLMPKQTGVDSSRIVTPFTGMNLDITAPKMVDFAADVFGSGVLVGLDRRNAIQRFVNVSANYEAIERYALRKANSFRVDYGEMATRLYDEAWDVVNLSV